MNLMEILADDRFGFRDALEGKNREFLKDQQGYVLDDIPGSPAIKRGINQSLKVVKEIVGIAGNPPAHICIEMARDEVGRNKGSRTKSRAKQLDEWYKAVAKDLLSKDLQTELKQHKDELDKEKLYLYFLQCGKCMYCEKPLNIGELSSYEVDHIVPRSMIKDDSIDNKVLVHHMCNQTKKDVFPLEEALRKKNFSRWKTLAEAHLISEKKWLFASKCG